jgi:hypothetical protein
MFALFLAITIALGLLAWAEFSPRRAGKLAQAQDLPEAAQSPPGTPEAKQRKRLKLPRVKLPRFKLRLFTRARKAQRDKPHADPSTPIVPLNELRDTHCDDAVPAVGQSVPEPAGTGDADADVMARIEAMLDAPEPQTDLTDDLPRITDFAPGDKIALELEGPAPRPEDIRFEADATRRHAIALIADAPVVLIENTDPATLTPAVLTFRAHAA